MKKNSRTPLMRWGIVFGLTAVYVLAFPPLVRILGPTATTLITIPVAAAVWYFGIMGGLISGFLGVLLTILYLIQVEKYAINELSYFGLIPRLAMLFLFVFIVDYLRKRIDHYIHTESDLLERERFFSLLNNLTHLIIVAPDFNAMMVTLENELSTLFEADHSHIKRWDVERNQLISAGNFLEPNSSSNKIDLASSVLEKGKPLTVEHIHASSYIDPDESKNLPDHSVMGIPLIVGEQKLGAALICYGSRHDFVPEVIKRAEQAGKQIAIAMLNAQRDGELKKRLHEARTLANISRALSETEKIGLSNVLQLIVTSAQELIDRAEQVVIHLLDKSEQMLIPEAISGTNIAAEGKKKMRLGEGVAGLVISNGEAINIKDVQSDSRFVKLNTHPSYRSLIVAPIQSGQQRLGTISIQSDSPNVFTNEDSELLSALGTQAAIAIENAHLLEDIQQTLKEVNALYRVNQGLVASLEPDKLLQDTVELLQKNFGYYYVQIYVVDFETDEFVMHTGSGEIGRQLKAKGHRLAAGEGIVGYTAETNNAFFTNNVDDVVSFVRNPLLPDTKSELAVPVKIGSKMLGLLDIHQMPPKYLSQRDIQLVSAVADQLAVALQKANLYEELQISLEQEKAIRNQLVQNERLAVMGRLLASVSHELNNPLQAIQNALFLLKEEKGISTQGQQDLNIVLAESEHMANMIERLRATYRPSQVKDFLPTQLNDIIEDVYALISPHLRHSQIAFEFHPEPELPAIPALSDQIRQVVINLVMNAVEAMPNGGNLTVSTELLEDTNEILCTVSDTGTGISPAILPNIFEAFVTDKQQGTGLGLTISYDIVLKHRGRISAENDPNRGSIFKVWLPTRNREIE